MFTIPRTSLLQQHIPTIQRVQTIAAAVVEQDRIGLRDNHQK
jgi:hypothetical protein